MNNVTSEKKVESHKEKTDYKKLNRRQRASSTLN
jgi:hypothetical protein